MSDWMDLLTPETRARFEAFLDGHKMPDYPVPDREPYVGLPPAPLGKRGPAAERDWDSLLNEVHRLVLGGKKVYTAARKVAEQCKCSPDTLANRYYARRITANSLGDQPHHQKLVS